MRRPGALFGRPGAIGALADGLIAVVYDALNLALATGGPAPATESLVGQGRLCWGWLP